uniref:Spectrin repeat containing, nuclear envelope family member 3 n=1 Tax=Cyprinodon variegatus TaxID=28743 RepID=A0A3Q2DE79_CYPVA
MTQKEQQEFTACLQEALAWMQSVQEQLKGNDNTQGPRDALEARLRETEKIHHSEDTGRMKVDQVLMAAEKLLQSEDEELKNSTNGKLKELKSQWEDTTTYIVHCHSRIEWVWLHWSEYLKAYEEFEVWLTKQQRSLDKNVELQLGPKEKLWQLDQHRVMVSDVDSQVALLERLLDEAAALHGRTQDPSVDKQAQQRMQEDYNNIRDRARERLMLLQKISDEHQTFQSRVQKFESWLVSKTRELTELMQLKETPENKLKALKTLDESVASEETTLQQIENMADAVRANTSPAGAVAVQEEAEELRLGWQRLRQGLCEAEEGLRCSLDSHSQYLTRCRRLGDEIGRIRELLQDLDQELEETQESKRSSEINEEQMEGQWRKYSGVWNTLAGKESQVELLKAQLKELFRFSEDSRHLSDDVLAVVKEHHSVKCRASRLCSESELELRSILQDPLLNYSQWANSVSQVMEASNNVSDFSDSATLLRRIEGLLLNSAELQERLGLLQVKGDLLDSVFGPERSDTLRVNLNTAVRNRELLHHQLLERKNRLQNLISRTKDFDKEYQLTLAKLSAFRERLQAADVLQPDILAKKSQLDQMLVLQKELEDGKAQLMVLETLISSSQGSRTQYEKLCVDWTELLRRDIVSGHESFDYEFRNMEEWMLRQKPESFQSVEGRHTEAERLLGEFTEKELQLQQIEAQSENVLRRTSKDGQVHILKDMERLKERWNNLQTHHVFFGSKGSIEIDWSQFEAWLSRENEVLMKIIGTNKRAFTAEEVQTRRGALQALRSRLPEGEQMFQLLLDQTLSTKSEDETLEDLRYRWMLYKSKLREAETYLLFFSSFCSQKPWLLWRICRLAFLLWLLFLALLLLAFLLPLMDDGNSCSLSNNFARSFSVMLRYDGPPPT